MTDEIPNKPRIAEKWKDWSPARRRLYERRKVNHSVRYRILKRDEFRCQLCGRGIDDQDDAGKPVKLHVDHKTSMAKGGKSTDDNLWTLCYDCNRGKGEHDVSENYEELKPPMDRAPGPAPKPDDLLGKSSGEHRVATVVETIEIDGEIINIYESGARYNVNQKKLIYPASNTLITGENATAYNRRRQELARAELVAGANEAVEHLKPDLVPLAGDMAYVRAIGYATQQKAMTPKDPKQTDAARLLLQLGERLGERETISSVQTDANTFIGAAVVDYIRRLSEPQEPVIDGLVRESDISRSNNLRIDAADASDINSRSSSPTSTAEDRDA